MEHLIRVLIVDDHFVVRQGLAMLLVARNGMKVVGEATTGREAIALAHTLQPDVIVMDMVLPEIDGPQAIGQIRQKNPSAKILVLTSFGEDKNVSAALQAGALGYLLKDSSPDDLFHAIRTVYRGHLVVPQALAMKLVQPAPTRPALDQLTKREVDVLKLVAQGQTDAEIARALSVSVTTVRTHIGNLLNKLNAANRTQLALFAVEQGLRSAADYSLS